MDKKSKFNMNLFVAVSLAALFIFLFSHLFLTNGSDDRSGIGENRAEDRYFFKENRIPADPFITDNPDLDEILAGPIISARDPNLGYDDAPVAIVEFSDFACDFCHAQEQVLKRLVQNHKYDIKLIWKDFPEADEGSESYLAAIAARCAQKQDMFWPYHDLLYDLNDDHGREAYLRIARLLELNTDDFARCFDNRETKGAIADNVAEAHALGIVGIPFIYVNDAEVMGEASYEELEEIVASELEKD